MKKSGLLILFLFLLSACAAIPLRPPQKTVSIQPGGETLPFPQFLGSIGNEKMIFIGEQHDRKKDHRAQYEVIEQLHKRGKKITIALEMFSTAMQWSLDEWVAGGMGEEDFKNIYYFEWQMSYYLYRDIFLFARKNKIPLVGINESESLIQEVARKGTKQLSKEALESVKFTPCSADPGYAKIIQGMQKPAHSGPIPYFCDAQRIRDHVIAYYIARLAETREDTIVVLLGGMHAVRPAVPKALQKHGSYKYKILMPGEYGRLLGIDSKKADYIWY